jgi:hypothetical protein
MAGMTRLRATPAAGNGCAAIPDEARLRTASPYGCRHIRSRGASAAPLAACTLAQEGRVSPDRGSVPSSPLG